MIQQYDDCVECKACIQICPKKCILFHNGVMELNSQQCINCGLCDSVCQIEHPICDTKLGRVYAAIGNSADIVNNSSSGGVANILYRYILKQGGIIYGAKYATDFVPYISSTADMKEVGDFLKSKYCFSDVRDSYKKCKTSCENNKLVMYIGLPCQIAGLKLYLKKNYENLILVDILCHGAPHYSIFKNHIKYLESKKKKRIISYQFRDKSDDTYGPYHYTITYADGKVENGSALWDAYYNGFLKANILKKSCYSCKYARKERISDITLGDFWKANECIDQLRGKKYISSIIVNTIKGENILDKCKDELCLYESSYEILEKSTHAVSKPPQKTENIDIEKLNEYKYYSNWACRYEHSFNVIVRKIKNMIVR